MTDILSSGISNSGVLAGTETVSFSTLFNLLLLQRGLSDPKKIQTFLSASLDQLLDPFTMKGMTEAVARIQRAVRGREKILIHGDYDVDGITAAALVARTLSVLEAEFLTFLPDRTEDGYGVSRRAIREAAEKKVFLLITVDCGITASEQIQLARSLGLDVIVIDHHRIPAEGVPPANIILNPQQSDCPYTFKDLSAAGLAFKLAHALLGNRALDFLDLAALSTVCDVAPLKEENRIIVKRGLQIIAERGNPGLRALVEASGIRTREINAGHIGFMLGPRINAAGRMSSPEIALRLLMTPHENEAQSLARVLDEENKARQKEERQVVKEAIAEVERTMNFNRDRVIVVARDGWHQGVIGIVASRLVERFHRPAIVIALDKAKGKGSGRSIKNFHLFLALESCKDLFEEFGGHEQAAGLSIYEKNIPQFRRRVNEYARENCEAQIFVRNTHVDLELRLEDIQTQFLKELYLLEPHGAGNPRPVFRTRGLILKQKPERLGLDALKLWITDGSRTFEAVWNDRTGADTSWMKKGSAADIAYTLKQKTRDGIESLTLDIKEMTPVF